MKHKRGTEATTGEARKGLVRFRCDLAEKGRWVKLARRDGKTLTQWIREKLNQ